MFWAEFFTNSSGHPKERSRNKIDRVRFIELAPGAKKSLTKTVQAPFWQCQPTLAKYIRTRISVTRFVLEKIAQSVAQPVLLKSKSTHLLYRGKKVVILFWLLL
jgi:hypothetical protein